MTQEVYFVNAFVKDSEGGNLAGVVLDAAALDAAQMQDIAAQVGGAETAFVLPSDEATYQIRFFTPTMEVDLCGHATIATWSLLFDKLLIEAGGYTEQTLAGKINLDISDDGLVFMEQPEQTFGKVLDRDNVAAALGISPAAISEDLPLQIVNDDNLMVGMSSEAEMDTLQPDMDTLVTFATEHNFYGFHIYVFHNGQESLAAVRNFCPRAGIPEDAATGTGNGSFLTYLQKYDKLPNQNLYVVEQGRAMGHPSRLLGKFKDGRVWVGGHGNIIKQQQLPLLEA